MIDEIITVGHYQSKNSLNSDKADIIRIIGEDSTREGYWKTQDGKTIPGYDILENWIKLDTHSTKEGKKLPPINIFDGLGDNSEIEEEFEQPTIHKVQPPIFEQELKFQEQLRQQNVSPIIQEQIIQEQVPFDISILEKINIDNLNKKAYDAYGIENKFKKPIIEIILPIVFNYDIDKLKQTIELLELDENIILDFLVKEITINTLRPLIKQRLKEKLLEEQNDLLGTFTNNSTIYVPIVEEKIELIKQPEDVIQKAQEKLLEKVNTVVEEKNKEILTVGINEVQKYLENYLSKE